MWRLLEFLESRHLKVKTCELQFWAPSDMYPWAALAASNVLLSDIDLSLLFQGLWSRFFPAYAKLHEELAAGTIGEPLYLSAQFGFPLLSMRRCAEHKLGGGCIIDMGSYLVSMCLLVFKEEPERIVASAIMQNGQFLTACCIFNLVARRASYSWALAGFCFFGLFCG